VKISDVKEYENNWAELTTRIGGAGSSTSRA
jgi:hypothetical protein